MSVIPPQSTVCVPIEMFCVNTGLPMGILPQETVVQVLFRPFPGLDSILKPAIAAQVVPLPFEADGRTPALLGAPPVHPRHAAGVVFPHSFRRQHFHAGAIDVGQS